MNTIYANYGIVALNKQLIFTLQVETTVHWWDLYVADVGQGLCLPQGLSQFNCLTVEQIIPTFWHVEPTFILQLSITWSHNHSSIIALSEQYHAYTTLQEY